MNGVMQTLLDAVSTPAQVAGLCGYDAHGIDGPHFYLGLGFAPVPGNHRGLADIQTAIEELAADAVRSADVLDGADELHWVGADADAFRARLAALPPVLRQYATTSRRFGELVASVETVMRSGKERAESLDREAVALKSDLLATVLPHISAPLHVAGAASLPGHVLGGLNRYGELLGAGASLYVQTRETLTQLGHEIEALSRQAPHLPTGVGRAIDDVADATGFVDRLLMAPPTRMLVDAFPDEAHLVAGVLQDGASLLGAVPDPVTWPIAAVMGASGFAVEQRLYRTGATNARGEALVGRADYVVSGVTAVPIPILAPEVRAGAKAAARTLTVGRHAQEWAGRAPTEWPETPFQIGAAAATVTGVPFLPSAFDYLDDKGVGVPPPSKPDVRLYRPLRPCDSLQARS